jgi:hypothetical protein
MGFQQAVDQIEIKMEEILNQSSKDKLRRGIPAPSGE